jgi:hypothetical protein
MILKSRRETVDIIPKETRALRLPGSDRLIKLIETEADDLAEELVRTLREHPHTPSFHAYTSKELYERAFNLYRNLGAWISRKSEREDLVKYYTALGIQRRQEGFPLSEVLHGLNLMRRVLWKRVDEQGLLDTAEDYMQAMELNNQVLLFFDRAILYTAKGYETSPPSP